MNISDKYLEELPINHLEAAERIIKDAEDDVKIGSNHDQRFKILIPYYSLLLELQGQMSEIVKIETPVITDNYKLNFQGIWTYICTFKARIDEEKRRREIKLEISSIDTIRKRFRIHIKQDFCYSFTDGEIKLIQEKINHLRNLVANSNCFSEEHRQRLLKRLEKLQQELHKKVSDLDRFWGFVGDAGVMLGKFGKDAKPLVDVVKDLVNTIWRVQTRSEGIEYKVMKLLEKPE